MPMKSEDLAKKSLSLLLAFALCGAPQMLAAQASTTPQSGQTIQPAANPQTADPSQAPLAPVEPPAQPPADQNAAPNSATAPAAPAATQPVPPEAPQPQAAQQQKPATPNQPQGTAAAQKGQTAGGAASQPAGTAIAPAKQRQNRSLLIKVGLIAGAAVAAGTVYALSRKTAS